MKTIVVVPTWNEKENIVPLAQALLKHKVEVLVVDDNSPDGTAQAVKNMKNSKVHLLLRTTNKGRGSAGIAGFKKALAMGADYIIEMDADFSHDPKYIPQLINQMNHADIALGSRFVKGGNDDPTRGVFRIFLTRGANFYFRLVLGMHIKDCNSGYRCFNRHVLETINLDSLKAKNADIVQEILYKCYQHGFTITEIPIQFKERVRGETTKNLTDYLRGLAVALRLRFSK